MDDPKLVGYFDELKIQDIANVGRDLTRAEFIKLLLNAAKIDVSHEDTQILLPFSDIDRNNELSKYVAFAVRKGIISGQEIQKEWSFTLQKILRPNSPISRAEASKILGEVIRFDKALPEEKDITTFADVGKNHTLAAYIEYAYKNCLLHGKNTLDGKVIGEERLFAPNDAITLAETAKILYNMTHK